MALGTFAALLLLGALALALTVSGVRDDLDQSRKGLEAARSAVGRGEMAAARSSLATAQRRSHSASSSTRGVLWTIYSHVPVVDSGVQEVRGLARALDATNRDVAPLLLAADIGHSGWARRIDPRPFRAAQAPLAEAERSLDSVRAALHVVPRSQIDVVHDARAKLEAGLKALSVTVGEARAAADAVPNLVSGSKTYLLAIQNNAEQRATGGLLGAYGVLRIVDGALHLDHIGPDQDLVDVPNPVIDLGQEYDQRYARFNASQVWRSANLTPDTPTASRVLAALWKARTGSVLDGVIMIDPVGLAHILAATGPVTLEGGTKLTEGNAVPLLLAQVYARFPLVDAQRNTYLQDAARKVVEALTSRSLKGGRLGAGVGRAIATGHLQVWSADPGVQAALERSRVAGVLSATGPFLEVVTQDVGGSKLGYYQRRSVSYRGSPTGEASDLGSRPVLEEEATVSVSLTNGAPANLPGYVTTRADDADAPRGQSRSWVSVYLGHDATLLRATLDGRPVALESGSEKGLSVFSAFVSVDRGSTVTLVLTVRQPSAPGQAMTWRQQPSVTPDELVVHRGGAPLDLVYER